jgi:hypothetical protein
MVFIHTYLELLGAPKVNQVQIRSLKLVCLAPVQLIFVVNKNIVQLEVVVCVPYLVKSLKFLKDEPPEFKDGKL